MKSIITALAALVTASLATVALAAEDWIIKKSPHDVQQTADKLVAAIEAGPPTLFARIDHGEGAKKAGLELEPTVLVIFGNPKIGTPIMQENRRAGIDLPVRVLIWEEGGQTMLGALDPRVLKERHEIDGADESFTGMAKALEKLMGAATQ